MIDKISMADLLAKNIAIDWFEAVSLVREVCTVLIGERIEESTPELAQTLLAVSGRVTITGTAHGDAPVRRLGQLLQALLLRSSDAPVTLRLVLSEAMAAPPVYSSISDLDSALAYFERPDRQAVLRGLYARATSAAPLAETPMGDLDEIAPLPSAQTQTKQKPRKPANRRALTLVGAGALLVSAAAVAYQRGVLPRTSWKLVGTRASAAVDKAVFTTVSTVTEMAGMGKLVAPGTDVSAAPLSPAPVSTPKRRANRTVPVLLAGFPVKLFDPQPAADVQPAVAAPDAASPSVLEASADPAPVPDSNIYGPADRDVAAPLAIRPHLPTLPQGVTASRLARIELVVAPDGLVESVKLVPGTAPVDVTEAMLLSAAKTWRFSPALKDGRTVRYRKTVFLSEQ